MTKKHKCIGAVLALLFVCIITGCASGPAKAKNIRELSLGNAFLINSSSSAERWYSVQSPTATTLLVYTTGNMDTALIAYNSDNRAIAKSDAGGDGRNALLRIRVEADKTYFFRVFVLSQNVRPFQIMATTEAIQQQAVLDARLEQAQALSFGTVVSARLDHLSWNDYRSTTDWYSVQSPTDTTAIVYTAGNTDTFLRAYDFDNRLIAEDDNSGEDRNARLEIPIEAGRIYLFRVNGSNNSTGSYQIIATSLALQLEQARPLSLGAAFSANLGRGTEQWYTVQSPTAVTVIVYSSGNTDTFLRAYGPNSLLIAEDDNSGEGRNARLEIPVEADITYLFRVSGSNNSSGSYQIIATTEAIQQQAFEERQRALEEQQRVAAAEAAAGFIDLWSGIAGTVLINGAASEFSVEANGTVQLRLEEAADREFTIAVRDSVNRVHQAVETIRFSQGTGPNSRRSALVFDPSPRPNPAEDFEFIQNVDGGLTITRYRGARRQVVIPDTLHGINVTMISDRVFEYRSNLLSVAIPNTVTMIGASAFRGIGFTSITLPASLRTIGRQAFSGNPFTRITLPANITETNMRAGDFEESLVNFYISQNMAAGTYVKNGPIWSRQ